MTTSDTYSMTSSGEIITVTGRIVAVLDPETTTEEAFALLARLNAAPVAAGVSDCTSPKDGDTTRPAD